MIVLDTVIGFARRQSRPTATGKRESMIKEKRILIRRVEASIAYKNVLVVIMLILAGFSLFNLIHNVLGFEVFDPFGEILNRYRKFGWTVFDFSFPFAVHLPSVVKDIAVFYFLLGGCVGRVMSVVFRRFAPLLKQDLTGAKTRRLETFYITCFARKNRHLSIAATVLIWPLIAVRMVKRPLVWANKAFYIPEYDGQIGRVYEIYEPDHLYMIDEDDEDSFDIRGVMVFQFGVTLATALVALLANTAYLLFT